MVYKVSNGVNKEMYLSNGRGATLEFYSGYMGKNKQSNEIPIV